ncbi:dihydropteroate synthase [Psychrobacter sp. I-STPA6b]|uniref:dihydropteroate synthase n=1 Tax=Psychrobacter sp. I-STPA6b TaxID=2585718 RepID=UPI001D0CC542|nr:dihydropteroate synthase [Psychrobacter sp. I-STPA6b]
MSLFNKLPPYQVSWQGRVLDLSEPKVMGILNVTPDSFSDGGKFNQVKTALAHCEQMLQSGVDIIDIGAESTRPNAKPISVQEQLNRIMPIIGEVHRMVGDKVWISIDTSNPQVIEAAVNAGAAIWNDVRGLREQGAAQMAANLQIPVVLMHMRGEPDTMNQLAQYDDVLDDVTEELQSCIDKAKQAGVRHENIIIDMGFGFAKNYEHHCQLLTQLQHFKAFDLPILFGISRKRFLGEVLSKSGVPAWQEHTALERDAVGMAAALLAVQQGASIVRTHDVAMTKQALALWSQLSQSVS